MLDALIKRLVAPVKPVLRRRLGEDYDLWANWAQFRIQSLQRRRGIYRGTRMVWLQPGHTVLESFQLVGPARDEVLIEVEASGLSPGTEVAVFDAKPNTSAGFPYVPGYSAVGKVLAVGIDVRDLQKGDRVAAPLTHGNLGIAKRTSVHRVPVGVGDEASLYVMAVIAYHGVHLAKVQKGERVIVMGRGIIGQFATQIAKSFKPSHLVSLARSPDLVTQSMTALCDQVVSTGSDPRESWSASQADVTFEVTGAPEAFSEAVTLTRDGGRIVLLGSSRGQTPDVDFAELARREIILVGAHTSTITRCAKPGVYDMTLVGNTVMEMMARGELDAKALVDHIASPAEAGELFMDLLRGKRRTVGTIVDWTQLGSPIQRVGFFSRPVVEQARNTKSLTVQTAVAGSPRPEITPAHPAVGIAIIGCGAQGGLNASDVVQAEGAELAGAFDPQSELSKKISDLHGCPVFSDLTEALANPRVEALFLTTPHHVHLPQVQEAAKAGKSVLVEKPLAANFADALQLVKVAEAAGITLGTWLGYRYVPEIVEATRLIKQGAIGTLNGAQLSFQLYKPQSYYQSSGWRSHWETAGGGILIMNGIHFLDAFLMLAGKPVVEVGATHSIMATAKSEVEDTIAFWIRFEGGALATVNLSSCAIGMSQEGPQMTLCGQEGTVKIGRPNQVFTLKPGLGVDIGRWSAFPSMPAMKPGGVEVVERFAAAVRNGSQPELDGREGLKVQVVIEAAYRSAELGRPVRIEEISQEKLWR